MKSKSGPSPADRPSIPQVNLLDCADSAHIRAAEDMYLRTSTPPEPCDQGWRCSATPAPECPDTQHGEAQGKRVFICSNHPYRGARAL